MSRWIEVLARQRPFPSGADENDRVLVTCNYDFWAAGPVDAFEDEVIAHLIAAGHATAKVQITATGHTGDIAVGPRGIAPPDDDGPIIFVNDTGGQAPEEIHNGSRYERLSCQIVVRAADHDAARTRALAIWRTLDGLRNQTVAA